ncbi:bis(5'-nucleosyl)-tetraphosphatase (symmetrical) ApaH [Candidatus Palibaumannia cicadellinicola]|uniref:Bis(5'-nucleosyl)-tetraphosphatase, symmetrical n=1 Tax=Candidatus Palibaumannia cicadellinicola TaxID=186490 RepID=A0A0K2BL32_9GAMM|nr:bis(5'-nucleosyl)-tetraphosphatase (symmetrical) ApaH [Candidatus Baumannia cicadellinicola]AKZ66091.1 Bis(5'-nucleosyl)-tetraphosphatase, symmetrical [Candidatus Baumannia cicadellinicola]
MSTYLIGDIHGCYDELQKIIDKVNFDPLIDTIWLTGDIVARGPGSLEVLRMIRKLGNSVRIVLGNHDLYLIAVYSGLVNNIKDITKLKLVLEASDVDDLINWLRYQPVLQVDHHKKLVMVHAGITPQWNLNTAIKCALEVENLLKSNSYQLLFNTRDIIIPNYWSQELSGIARLKFITNVFTRMRYCFPNGTLDLTCKNMPDKNQEPLRPWFTIPNQIISENYSIVFGHWASLMGKGTPEGFYCLDTGCCWGGELTLICWENKKFTRIPATTSKSTK